MNLVMYDGQCGLCDSIVQWLLRIDRAETLTFAPLQGAPDTLFFATEKYQSIVFIAGFATFEEKRYRKFDAVIQILKTVGGIWKVFVLFKIFPAVFRDALYDWIAVRRFRWFGNYEQCKLPPTSTQRRFMFTDAPQGTLRKDGEVIRYIT